MRKQGLKKFLCMLVICLCCICISGYSTLYTFKAQSTIKVDSAEDNTAEDKKPTTEKSENLFFHEPIFAQLGLLNIEQLARSEEFNIKLPTSYYPPIKPPPDFS